MYTRPNVVRKIISQEQAQEMITEARFFEATNNLPAEIIAYQNINGTLYKTYTIPIINGLDYTFNISAPTDLDLLDYVRKHIPDEIHF